MNDFYDLINGWDSGVTSNGFVLEDIHGEEGTQIITADVEEALGTLNSNYFDAIVVDPPYGVNINSKWDGNLPRAEVWMQCCNVLKPGGHMVIFGQPSMAQEFCTIMEVAKYRLSQGKNKSFEFRDMWIWAYQGTHTKGFKTEDGSFRSKIRNIFNPIYVYRKELEGTEEENWNKWRTNLLNIDPVRQEYKGNHNGIIEKYERTGEKHLQSEKPSNTFRDLKRKGWLPDEKGAEPTNIQYCPRATRAERTINGRIENNHQTVKPLSIMLWILNLVTHNTNQVVLDCFSGTGSTGMACKLLGRRFVGIDNDVSMVKIANFRIKNVYELDRSLFKRRPI
jgi:DNA modification methylase